jgi:hypothetical protein
MIQQAVPVSRLFPIQMTIEKLKQIEKQIDDFRLKLGMSEKDCFEFGNLIMEKASIERELELEQI